MTTNYVTPGGVVASNNVIEEPVDARNRILGLSFLIIEIGVMFAYGFAGSFSFETNPSFAAYQEIISVVLLALFVLVGFGLLLSTYRFANWLGTTTAIVVVAISVQLAPLLQKFWFSVFITGFGDVNDINTVSPRISAFYSHFANNEIEVSSYMNRITFVSCISLMVVNTAIVGRLNLSQILLLTSVYQFMWNLNYFLLLYLAIIKQDHSDSTLYDPSYFDEYGVTFNYIFAAAFGLVFTIMSVRQKVDTVHPRNEYNRTSLVLSAVGTAFIFAAFMFTGTYFVRNTFLGRNVIHFNVFWGLTASVIGTYVGSLLVGKGRIGYKEALVGTISGGIVMGSASQIMQNIGLVIMIGAIAGLISGIYMRVIHPRINKNQIYDFLGLMGPFFISALIGGLVVAPAAIIGFHNNNHIPLAIDQNTEPYHYSLAGWQLVYVGISIGIGLGSGLLAGLLGCCYRESFGLLSNSRVYENDFGLYTQDEDLVNIVTPAPAPKSNVYVDNSNSAAQINNQANL